MNLKLFALAAAALVICGCERKVIVEKDHHQSPDAVTDSAAPDAAPSPAVSAAPDPQYYEEGATYNGTVITEPPDVSDYVLIGGGYYYWQPTLNIWVHAHHPDNWRPPQAAHVYHNWTEHPMYRRGR